MFRAGFPRRSRVLRRCLVVLAACAAAWVLFVEVPRVGVRHQLRQTIEQYWNLTDEERMTRAHWLTERRFFWFAVQGVCRDATDSDAMAIVDLIDVASSEDPDFLRPEHIDLLLAHLPTSLQKGRVGAVLLWWRFPLEEIEARVYELASDTSAPDDVRSAAMRVLYGTVGRQWQMPLSSKMSISVIVNDPTCPFFAWLWGVMLLDTSGAASDAEIRALAADLMARWPDGVTDERLPLAPRVYACIQRLR